MRIVIIVFALICIMLNPVFLFAQKNPDYLGNKRGVSKEEEISRQKAEAVNKDLNAQMQKSNAEVEQIRLKAEEQMLKDMKQAEKDLDKFIQDFQSEKFPEEVKEEKSPEAK